ncbi:MAG: serine/threonine-protein kinase [Myxococcaceae bacterium]
MSEGTPLLAPGVVIAETYEVERQLGRGGMGEVWLAKHRRLAGKQVAIKVLHVDRALPQEALARFKREAEIAARLEHPNIVQVLDFNTLPTGQPYLVMEFLKGQSLAARVQGQPASLELLTTVMRQVGAALQAAHQAGIVHRDLKPENIFLVPTAVGDQVKVLDFGISKLSDSNTVQTTDSVLIGTPLYMSPEQALGHNREVGPQSDLFSLGSIAYELVTGRAPFAADQIVKVVYRIVHEKHPPFEPARADVPATVIAAIEHALQKDRSKRTPTVEAFVEELTGQPLARVGDTTSGVMQPGMPISASMISGETRPGIATPRTPPPSAPPAPVAPSSPAAPAPKPAPGSLEAAPTVSGKKFVIGVVSVVAVLAAIVTKVRLDNWAERAAYRAQMIDAGWTLMPDGNLTRDAGTPSNSMFVAEPTVGLDAGVGDAGETVPDAGVNVPDAGKAVVVAPKAEEKMTDAEAAELTEKRALATAGKWDQLWATSTNLRAKMNTPAAKRAAIELLIDAACHRFDLSVLNQLLNEYRQSGRSPKPMRAKCVEAYPSAGDLDW